MCFEPEIRRQVPFLDCGCGGLKMPPIVGVVWLVGTGVALLEEVCPRGTAGFEVSCAQATLVWTDSFRCLQAKK